MSAQFSSPAAIWPLLEKRYLAHGWQGRLFGLDHWLKAGIVKPASGDAPHKAGISVIAVGNAGGNADALQDLPRDNCELILAQRAGSELPQPNACADIHLVVDAETPLLTARNIGAGVSSGAMLIFLPADSSPQAGFVDAYAHAFSQYPDAFALRGSIISEGLDDPAAITGNFRLPDDIDFWPLDLEENMAIRAQTFFEMGGFDEALPAGYGALDLSIRMFGKYPDFARQRHAPEARIVWQDAEAHGLPFAEYLSLRQRSWLTINENMKRYLDLYARFWQEHAHAGLEASHA